jgi:hypothetical protein
MSPDVSGCTNIEEIYCEGTSIAGIKLPSGGILKTLHLPNTVVNLQVVNQPQLSDFSIPSYNQITTLRLENAGVLSNAALDILNVIPENSRVRILGINIPECTAAEAIAFCDRLDTMRGLDENGNNMDKPQVSGTIYIPSLTSEELYRIHSRYPSITVIYNNIVTYTVRFYNGTTLLQTVEDVLYGANIKYIGETPLKDGEVDETNWSFTGWNPEPTFVAGNMDCYAQFKFNGSLARELIQRTIAGDYENDRVTSVGGYAFYSAKNIVSVDFTNVISIGTEAFRYCDNLVSADFPNLTTITGSNAFYGSGLQRVSVPKLTAVPNSTFYGTQLTELTLESATSLANSCLSTASKLKRLDLHKCKTITGWNALFCESLETLIIRTESVCVVGSDCIHTNTPIAKGTGYIYVPRALVDSYKAATNWAVYAAQFRAIEDYPEICGGEV